MSISTLRALQTVSVILACGAVAALFAPASAEIAAPKAIKERGKILFCTDLSYPPWEQVDSKTLQPAGVDIDLAAAIAKAMGVTAEHKNITFDGLIPAMQAGQCDAIISTMIDKPERREVVAFVDYASMGNCLIVLSSTDTFFKQLTDLSGRKVAVQSSTIAEEDLKKANDALRAQGKSEMQVVALPSNVDAMQQLNATLVDAYYGVPEQAVYFNEQRPGSVKVASPTMSARPAGIASPKNDAELHAALEAAFKVVRESGEYDKIFEKGGVASEKIAN